MINPGATSTPRRRRATAATAWDPSGAPAASDGFDAWPMRVVTYIAYLLLLSSLLWTLFRGSDPEAGGFAPRPKTEGKAQPVSRRWGEVSVSEGPSCAVSFLLEIFTDSRFQIPDSRFQFGVSNPRPCLFLPFYGNPKAFSGRRAVWGQTPPFVSVARAASWARGRQMCVPPAKKGRDGVPMIGRMGGGAEGTASQRVQTPRHRAPLLDHVAPYPKSHCVPAFSSPPHPRSGADLRDLNP